MTRSRHVVAAFLFLFAVQFGSRAWPGDLSGPGGGLETGWHRFSIDVGGLKRWFRVFVPSRRMDKAPVVLLLHGGGRSMDKIFSKRAGGAREWPELAKRERFLLLAPNGTNSITGDPAGDLQQWNDLRGASPLLGSSADDVAFLLHLLRWAHAMFRTDAKRVYVTGASNGGMMTYKMLIEHPEVFAAGAAFLANLPIEPVTAGRPARSVPIMIVNGTKDPLMKYGGGRLWLGRGTFMSAMETALWWAEANGSRWGQVTASTLPDADPKDGCRIRVTRFQAATSAGAPVYLYTMAGGGHAMPSRKHALHDRWIVRQVIGPRCRDAEAAELAWNFFRQFTR